MMRPSLLRSSFLLVGALSLFACPGPVPTPDPVPPTPQDDAGVECDAGECGTDVCDPNPCVEAHRTQCATVDGAAHCSCDEGYVDESGACVVADPCAPNLCSEPNRGVCVAAGASFTCECNDGYELKDGACLAIVPICPPQHQNGDAFEPDECASIARVLTGDLQSEAHTVEPVSDEDWFRFPATANTVYSITAGSPDLKISLSVFEADGSTVVASTAGFFPSLKVRPLTDGELLLRARADIDGLTGDYTISITTLGLDDHGNDSTSATPVSPAATPHDATTDYAGDNDWFSFDAVDGNVYALLCTSPTAACSVQLYRPDGSPFVRPASTETDEWFAKLPAGRHFFALTTDGGAGTQYSFTLEDHGPDDHADVNAAATPLTLATPTGGNLQYWGDVDVLGFTRVPGHIYEISCVRGSGLQDCYMTLRDATDAVLAAHTTGGDGKIRHEAAAAGDAFVRVSTDVADRGAFTLSVTDLGTDDFGDDPLSAHPISYTTSPTTQSGALEIRGDLDFFSVSLTGPQKYAVKCVPTGFECDVTVVNSIGGLVGRDSTGPDYKVIVAPGAATETYTVRIGSRFDTGVGTYDVVIEAVADDHGNDLASATLVGITGGIASGSGEFEINGDIDVLAADLTGGVIYQFTCTPTSANICNLTLRDGADVILVRDGNDNEGRLYFKPASTGRYFIRMAASSLKPTGTYTWLLEETTLTDDHGDSFATATPIPVGGGSQAGILTQNEEDWFVFSPPPGNYRLTGAGNWPGSATSTIAVPRILFTIYKSDGVTVHALEVENQRDFTIATPGDYFIRVRGQQTNGFDPNLVRSGTGPYQITLAPR